MKSKDLELLNSLIEKEGFEIDITSNFGKSHVIVSKKEEKIEVKFSAHIKHNKFNRFDFMVSKDIKQSDGLNKFMTEQLEKYLNNEQNRNSI